MPLDDRGRASVDIPLNDSLTSFRIIAVADSAIGLFGTGQTSIRVTQDPVISGLPPLIREGDRFDARFTVRNASQRQSDVEVSGNVAGQALPASRVTLAPGAAREVGWDVTAPFNVAQLRWEVAATEVGSSGMPPADRLKVQQKVIPAVPVRTFQATLAQLDQPLDLAVKIPEDAVPGRGGIRVALAPKLADDIPGVREYVGASLITIPAWNSAHRALSLCATRCCGGARWTNCLPSSIATGSRNTSPPKDWAATR